MASMTVINTVAQVNQFVAITAEKCGSDVAKKVQFVFESYGESEGRWPVANDLAAYVKTQIVLPAAQRNFTQLTMAALEAGFQG